MTIEWLDGRSNAKPHPAIVFRQLLTRKGIVAAAGAHDGMAAVLARDAGFEALYLSGAALSA